MELFQCEVFLLFMTFPLLLLYRRNKKLNRIILVDDAELFSRRNQYVLRSSPKIVTYNGDVP